MAAAHPKHLPPCSSGAAGAAPCPNPVRLLQLGVPAGWPSWWKLTSFTLMALFIARQGTTAAAAHQIAANMAALLYMVPLSLVIATSTRVSYWLGAGQALRAQRVVYIGFRLAALTGIALAAILFIANQKLRLFIPTARRGRCGVRAAAGWRPITWRMHRKRCASSCCEAIASPSPLGGVLRIAVGAGAGRRLPGGLQRHRHLGSMAASPAAFWAWQRLALLVTAAAFMVMLAKGSSAFNAPCISVGGLPGR